MITKTAKTDSQGALRIALWSVALVGASGAMLAGIVGGLRPMLSLSAGALLAFTHLWLIALVIRGRAGQLSPNVPWGLVGVLKFVVLFGAMYVLVKSHWVEVLPLFIGYGALPLGIVAAQMSFVPKQET
jgi:hypothetical protein